MKSLILPVLFAIVGLYVVSFHQADLMRSTRSDVVYAVCNSSRTTPNVSERECARLQEQWHREFMCVDNNDSPDNYCWVEVK